MYFARSPKPERGIPAQAYEDHIAGVYKRVCRYADEIATAMPDGDDLAQFLSEVCKQGALLHDLGKLDPKNQEILSGKRKAKRLDIAHWDAGAAHLLQSTQPPGGLAAWCVYAHHLGLPDLSKERARLNSYLRDDDAQKQTDERLADYLKVHEDSCGDLPAAENIAAPERLHRRSVFLRIALSCLVDADHSDARAAGQAGRTPEPEAPPLRAAERLAALDAYTRQLSAEGETSERNALRAAMYESCRNAENSAPIYYCDSPVGTGKTTAIMAGLLNAAQNKNLRRIFVVLPYTNIITQAVEVYRNALCLPGENPEAVVAAHHSRTDFDSEDLRELTTTWRAPIVVTTAVQFFETMAAAHPSTLRKLHNLPGSAIFIDEAHAALTAKLWPQAWLWLKEYANLWNCHIVLGSGSLNKFWKLKGFDEDMPDIPALVDADFSAALQAWETGRVEYKLRPAPLALNDLADSRTPLPNQEQKESSAALTTIGAWLASLPGPRLLIVNTVQSAAFIADSLAQKDPTKVEHLSTALTPRDRAKTLEAVRARLANKADEDWTLVATSCVEAGVDLSFRTGIREAASLVSLLQIAGRVNRNNEYASAEVWTIRLLHDAFLNEHPAFKESARVLLDFFDRDKISPQFCTEALRQELLESNTMDFNNKIKSLEQGLNFMSVAERFKVIESDTYPVIIGQEFIDKLKKYEKVEWQTLQENSVQLWANKIDELRLPPVCDQCPDLFAWPYEYDTFLGYMAGVIKLKKFSVSGFGVF